MLTASKAKQALGISFQIEEHILAAFAVEFLPKLLVIFCTLRELYNHTQPNHCTGKPNRKWIQQNHVCMNPKL